MRTTTRHLALLVACGLLGGACSGNDGAEPTITASTGAPETTAILETTAAPATTEVPATTEAPEEVLRILVSNDDGVKGEGMDAVVRALSALANVEVIVISPLDDQSGSSDRVSDTPPPVTEETTVSGFPARAVAGFPADSIVYAFSDGVLAQRPHLVVTGLNEGQNIGPAVLLSGTVGAARTAVRQGVPALATSQQFADELDYETGARFVVAWVEANREQLLAGSLPVQTYNLNVPSCPEGEPRGVVEVPVLGDLAGRDYMAVSDCVGDVDEPDNDVDALQRGWVSLSIIAPD